MKECENNVKGRAIKVEEQEEAPKRSRETQSSVQKKPGTPPSR